MFISEYGGSHCGPLAGLWRGCHAGVLMNG